MIEDQPSRLSGYEPIHAYDFDKFMLKEVMKD